MNVVKGNIRYVCKRYYHRIVVVLIGNAREREVKMQSVAGVYVEIFLGNERIVDFLVKRHNLSCECGTEGVASGVLHLSVSAANSKLVLGVVFLTFGDFN